VVKDATGQALAYIYARETKADADIAHVLTMASAVVVKYPRHGGNQIWLIVIEIDGYD
jgi:hypothetical protein